MYPKKIGLETNMTAELQKIGIECVRRQDIAASYKNRLANKEHADPSGLGFDHMKSKSEMDKMDMNSVRLSFQLFIPWNENGMIAGPKIASDVIKDKRVHENLKIVDISDNFSPVKGGKKIIMFTSKVKHEDIKIRFEHNHNGITEVLEKGIGASEVHKQCAISFEVPIFTDHNITQEVQAKIYLFRPSDGEKSNEENFRFVPNKQSTIIPQKVSTHAQQLPTAKPNQDRKRGKGRIVSSSSQNFEEQSTRELENPPKQHPSTDCGGKVEMISTFTNMVNKGHNAWKTSTISFEDIYGTKNEPYSPGTPGS